MRADAGRRQDPVDAVGQLLGESTGSPRWSRRGSVLAAASTSSGVSTVAPPSSPQRRRADQQRHEGYARGAAAEAGGRGVLLRSWGQPDTEAGAWERPEGQDNARRVLLSDGRRRTSQALVDQGSSGGGLPRSRCGRCRSRRAGSPTPCARPGSRRRRLAVPPVLRRCVARTGEGASVAVLQAGERADGVGVGCSQALAPTGWPLPLISPAMAGPADRTRAAPAAAVVTRMVLMRMRFLPIGDREVAARGGRAARRQGKPTTAIWRRAYLIEVKAWAGRPPVPRQGNGSTGGSPV